MHYDTEKNKSTGITEEEIRNSIEKNEVKLTIWEKLNHYGIVGLQSIIIGLYLYGFVRDHWNKTLNSSDNLLIGVFTILILIPILTYILLRHRLQFKSIETGLKRSELNDIIRETGIKHKWTLLTVNEYCIVAKTNPRYFPVNRGERITIIFEQKRVYINSICDPVKSSPFFTFGQNRSNVNRLMEGINRRAKL